jgi:hypothetical protein
VKTFLAPPRAGRPAGPLAPRRSGARARLRPAARLLVAAALPVLAALPAALGGQEHEAGRTLLPPGAAPSAVPFQAGESLTYRVRIPKFGSIGRGTMTVSGPEDVRGAEALILRFDFSTRIGFVKAENHSESWIDPTRMAALRFHKHERHPLSTHDEVVEMFPAERKWQAADGTMGTSTTSAPLDELSFIYFIRTLPLGDSAQHVLDRHFDPKRNPTTVRVLGRERLTTPAGTFATVIVEMRVKDARRYKGEGVLRIHLTDDDCRLPVRIESDMPIVGRGVLLLEKHTHPASHHDAAGGV